MRMYLFKTPGIFEKIWPSYTWKINTSEKILYLTFDDGPHPIATPFVLTELAKYDAKATFFCIGKNVESHQDIYEQIIKEGHSVGNHTHNHLNGWHTNDQDYLEDVVTASTKIKSILFRPPYGRIKRSQGKEIAKSSKIIMWSVLSGDFDTTNSAAYCIKKITKSSGPGSIIVFHDSEKAYKILKETLPATLSYYNNKGYRFEKLV